MKVILKMVLGTSLVAALLPVMCCLAPTLLSVMGVPVPGDMDGRVLTEAFEEALAPASVSGPAALSGKGEGSTGDGYSDSEAREVSERLRSLGYLD